MRAAAPGEVYALGVTTAGFVSFALGQQWAVVVLQMP